MTAPRWTTGTVASGGEDIYYEVVGDGDTTVLLGHGAGGSHAAWFQQLPGADERRLPRRHVGHAWVRQLDVPVRHARQPMPRSPT